MLVINLLLTQPHLTTTNIATADPLPKVDDESAAVKNQPELKECTTSGSDEVNFGGVLGESDPESCAHDAPVHLASFEDKRAIDDGERKEA